MIRIALALVIVASIVASQAAASPRAEGQTPATFCAQISGPKSDWAYPRTLARLLGVPARFTGRRWTVISWGTPCAFAVRSSRQVLRHWVNARPGTIIRGHGVRAWYCSKEAVPRGGKGSPGGRCLYLGIRPRFGFIQFGALKPAQVKRLIARGRLPGGG
jgi:hypothetical protein